MKSGESIECAIRIGNLAKLLLSAHGMNDKDFITLVIREAKQHLADLETRLATFQEAR